MSRSELEPARLAVAVGHTLGHVHPALAFLAAYRDRAPVEAIALGPESDSIRRLVEEAGLPFAGIASAPWQGESALGRLKAAMSFARGTVQARRHLARHRAGSVVGFGGYATVPALLAGRSLGVVVAIHEANVVPGLTNRLLARLADRVFVSHPESSWAGQNGRAQLVGVPVRRAFSVPRRGEGPRADGPVRLLVTSGSRGGAFLARRVPDLAARLREAGAAVEVRQQSPADAVDALRVRYAGLGVPATVETYVPDMPEACAWAHVAICRAGAATLAEIAAAGLPAIVVPLADAADDHQAANARAFTAPGGAVCVAERDWNAETQASLVLRWAREPGAWREASEAVRTLGRPEAAGAMAAECEALLYARRRARGTTYR